ncbi:DUF2147 domain-containing protein [uncultured Lentibacter sp.]|uniref:DUF2147 domain-containing protein n=1 Tax=uncultured Lentibacter sp. TaxID=1659309 RepID=UPI002605163D|nr:DUF2147 domain-containing protein [uncultured Lentibacter sp.]
MFALVRAGLLLSMLLASAAQAERALGLWRTEADDKGQVGHVSVAPCGAALCGTIVKAYDAQAREVKTANVGRMILLDMVQTSAGNYGGRVLIPKFNRSLNGRMQVSGDRMKISGCLLGICDSQTWVRLK